MVQRSYSIEVGILLTPSLINFITITWLQNGYPGKTRSLVGDAKFEKLVRRESRQSMLSSTDIQDKDIPEVTDDEAQLLESLEDEAANSKITLSFLIKLTSGCYGVGSVIHILEVEDGNLVHIETRQPRDKTGGVDLDVLVTVEIVKDRIIHLARRVKSAKYVHDAKLVGCRRATVQGQFLNFYICQVRSLR